MTVFRSPRWKKVLADLWVNKVRTLLVGLSIAVGVFAVGFVTTSYWILSTDIQADFLTARPRAAQLYTQGFDDAMLAALRRVPGVADVEGRGVVSVRLLGQDGSTYPMQISRVGTLSEMHMDLLRLESGRDLLYDHELLLERQVAEGLGYEVGSTLQVDLPDGSRRALKIAGTVQDVTGSSFLYSKNATGFTNSETLVWLGGSELYTRLAFTVSEQSDDEDHVRDVAREVADQIRSSGLRVYTTSISRPGQHPNQQIVTALLALMGSLGLLSLALSAFLVINTISGLLGQQTRQIGVMKALGASFGQVAGLYMVYVLTFGVVALVLAIPAAAAGAYAMCALIGKMMNINLAPFHIPLQAVLLQALVALGVPVLSALVPVAGSARITVREAITSYGLSTNSGKGALPGVLETAPILPRPLAISIRNTFRRRGRLELTLSTLTLGGAIFIAVFCVRDAISQALDKTFGYTLADVNISLSRPDRIEQLREMVKDIPGVAAVEGWAFESAQAMHEDGKNGDDVQVVAPPAGSKLILPSITAGRWLRPEDTNGLVVGNHYLKIRPQTRVGDTLWVRVGEKDLRFQIIGIYEMAGSPASPMVFTNYEPFAARIHRTGQVSSLRIVTDRHDPTRQKDVQTALEARFRERHIIAYTQTGSDSIQQQTRPVQILIILLLVMALLIAVVGGLGLASTMSMNVMERSREIGVMRSIGALNRAIFLLVLCEGLLIGLISWGLGALLSVPVALLLDRAVGIALLNVPLHFSFSQQGLWIWLVVVLVLAGTASLLPARAAIRLTIRDVLAYE